MSCEVYRNFYSFEASVSAAVTVSFPWESRRITITNDSSLTPLSITIGGDNLHLRQSESFSAEFWTKQVVINAPASSGIGLRIWVWG